MVSLDMKISVHQSIFHHLFWDTLSSQVEARLREPNIHHRVAVISLLCGYWNGRKGHCGVKEMGGGPLPLLQGLCKYFLKISTVRKNDRREKEEGEGGRRRFLLRAESLKSFRICYIDWSQVELTAEDSPNFLSPPHFIGL